MSISTRVRSMVLTLAAASLVVVGCAQSDAGITTKVKSKLAADDTVKAYQIDVDTKNKVVTLSGTVDSDSARDKAVELARGTEGVTDVVVNLVVAGPGGASGEPGAVIGGDAPNPEPDRSVGEVVDDASITVAVKTKLLADPVVGGLKIDVDTREGVVILTGDGMKSQSEIDQAVKLARETSGVKKVDNKLTVGERKG